MRLNLVLESELGKVVASFLDISCSRVFLHSLFLSFSFIFHC